MAPVFLFSEYEKALSLLEMVNLFADNFTLTGKPANSFFAEPIRKNVIKLEYASAQRMFEINDAIHCSLQEANRPGTTINTDIVLMTTFKMFSEKVKLFVVDVQ